MNSNKTELVDSSLLNIIRDDFLEIFCKFRSTIKKFG